MSEYSTLIEDAERWFLFGVSVFQSLLLGSSVGLPQLPLPCISSSATRVYFGHQRCLAEGSHLSVLFHRRKKNSFLTDLNPQTEALRSVFNVHLAQLNPNPGLFQVLSSSCSSQDPSAEGWPECVLFCC